MRTASLTDRDDVYGAIRDAYHEGAAAYASDVAYRSDNPYKCGTECRRAWLAGWMYAAQFDDEGTE